VLLIERQGSVQSNEKQNTRKSEHSTIGHHKKKRKQQKEPSGDDVRLSTLVCYSLDDYLFRELFERIYFLIIT
jgi:hypothetical protein